jgi:small GTP-binding protein
VSAPRQTYKIVVCGDGSVGKTSLILKYTQNTFNENYMATVGANFATKKLTINGVEIISQYWDMGGQPQFKFIRQNFYRGARGIIYVYDVTRRETFINLEKWIQEVNQVLSNVPCILIGNKIDLPRQVDESEAREYSSKINAKYFETSVAQNINVQESMDSINYIISEKQESLNKSITSPKTLSPTDNLFTPPIRCPVASTSSKYPLPESVFPEAYRIRI